MRAQIDEGRTRRNGFANTIVRGLLPLAVRRTHFGHRPVIHEGVIRVALWQWWLRSLGCLRLESRRPLRLISWQESANCINTTSGLSVTLAIKLRISAFPLPRFRGTAIGSPCFWCICFVTIQSRSVLEQADNERCRACILQVDAAKRRSLLSLSLTPQRQRPVARVRRVTYRP